MSVRLNPNAAQWILDREYEINRISLTKTEEPHTHDFIEIVYTYHGKGRHVIDDREYLVSHGDLLLINYGSRHTVEPIDRLQYVDIMLKPEYVDETLRGAENALQLLTLRAFSEFDGVQIKENAWVRFDGEERKKIEGLIEWTEEEQRKSSPGGDLMRHSALNLLLSMIFRKMADEQQSRLSINEDLLAYIREKCKTPIRVDELARRCFYTPEHFSRAFKRYTGIAPKEYVTLCRIRYAEKLLQTTDMPVERIISECGFSNRTAFFQQFSKTTGQTPLQYRKDQK